MRGRCRSPSINTTRCPAWASATARLTAVRDLPSSGAGLVISNIRKGRSTEANWRFVRSTAVGFHDRYLAAVQRVSSSAPGVSDRGMTPRVVKPKTDSTFSGFLMTSFRYSIRNATPAASIAPQPRPAWRSAWESAGSAGGHLGALDRLDDVAAARFLYQEVAQAGEEGRVICLQLLELRFQTCQLSAHPRSRHS